jgi:hypothetical protein
MPFAREPHLGARIPFRAGNSSIPSLQRTRVGKGPAAAPPLQRGVGCRGNGERVPQYSGWRKRAGAGKMHISASRQVQCNRTCIGPFSKWPVDRPIPDILKEAQRGARRCVDRRAETFAQLRKRFLTRMALPLSAPAVQSRLSRAPKRHSFGRRVFRDCEIGAEMTSAWACRHD